MSARPPELDPGYGWPASDATPAPVPAGEWLAGPYDPRAHHVTAGSRYGRCGLVVSRPAVASGTKPYCPVCVRLREGEEARP